MKNLLKETRKPELKLTRNAKIRNTLLICLLGMVLGALLLFINFMPSMFNSFSWLSKVFVFLKMDKIISMLGIMIFVGTIIAVKSETPLRSLLNTFLFCLFSNLAFHLCSIVFLKVDLYLVMFEEYVLTMAFPLLAYIIWYAKGKNVISIIISATLIAAFLLTFFKVGIWSFNIVSPISVLMFAILIIMIYDNIKNTVISVGIGVILAFLCSAIPDAKNLLVFVILYVLAVLFQRLILKTDDFMYKYVKPPVIRYFISLFIVITISILLAFIPVILHNSNYFLWGYEVDKYYDINIMSYRGDPVSLRSIFLVMPGVFAIYEGLTIIPQIILKSDKLMHPVVTHLLYGILIVVGLLIMILTIDFYFNYY